MDEVDAAQIASWLTQGRYPRVRFGRGMKEYEVGARRVEALLAAMAHPR